jgi:hypothetical protein
MMMRLTPEQVNELVNLLLDCPAIQDRRIRTDVLAFLPDNVRAAIPQRDQDRADVVNIVRTCNNYPGALEELIAGVRCFDEGTFAMQALDDFRQGVFRPAQRPPQPSDPNQFYLRIEDTLPHTDFKRAISTAETIFTSFDSSGGAALFLLQKSRRMGAPWCVRRMRDLLNATTRHFVHIPVGFSFDARLDEFGVLLGIARYFNIATEAASLERYTQEIITSICGSLQSGSVVFIEVSQWDYLQPQDRILTWFVNNFWQQLVRELPLIVQTHRKVRFVAVIGADGEIPMQQLPAALCCVADEFDAEKILPLELEHWSVDDIRDWLESYSGLPAWQIDQVADTIYDASDGVPKLVADILLEKFAHIQEQ